MLDTTVLKENVMHGLGAAKAGMEVAAKATSEIQEDISNSALKELLQDGERHSHVWMERVESAIAEVGDSSKNTNEILEAMYDVSKKIRRNAPNDESRDLGIIANGQLALHYWIAAFGTLSAYCEKAGFSQAAQNLEACLEEAKAADQRHTEVAEQILGGQAGMKRATHQNQSHDLRQ